MPISVVCGSCKARFSVSEKFAGKKGPCPKCKAIITVPDAPAEDIKIHVPEQFASAGKDSKGRPVSKPIPRRETKVTPAMIGAIGGAVIVTFAAALLLRGVARTHPLPVIIGGLAVLSLPLSLAAYTFLRDDELEPYRGRGLLLRAALVGLAYALLWAAFYPLPAYGIVNEEPWRWVFIAPVFISAGAGVAWACLDLDFASAAMHYCFYVVITLLLRACLGLPPLWAAALAASPY